MAVGFLLLVSALGFVLAGAWALNRWTRDFEDEPAREHRDPPIFDAGNTHGGGF